MRKLVKVSGIPLRLISAQDDVTCPFESCSIKGVSRPGIIPHSSDSSRGGETASRRLRSFSLPGDHDRVWLWDR